MRSKPYIIGLYGFGRIGCSDKSKVEGWERGRSPSDCTNNIGFMAGEAVQAGEEWEAFIA